MKYYADICKVLENELEGFSSEQRSTKLLICKLLFHSSHHTEIPEALSIGVELIEAGHFKSKYETFLKVNETYKLFGKVLGYKPGSHTTAWIPTPEHSRLRLAVLSKGMRTQIRDSAQGDRIVIALPEFQYIEGIKITTGVEIDRDVIRQLLEEGSDNKVTLLYLQQLYLLSNNNLFDGRTCIPSSYVKSPNGRLFGTGISLQYCKRKYRKRILAGYYDYDITNCHVSILCNYSDLPSLNHYNDNTTAVRSALASDLDLTIDQVKGALLAMFYGAKVGLKSSLAEVLGTVAKQKEFVTHKVVDGLLKDFFAAGEALLDKNLVKIPKNITSFNKKLAFTLMNIESQILKVVCELIPPQLLMFDGLISKEDIDVIQVQQHILVKMNLKIKIKKELI